MGIQLTVRQDEGKPDALPFLDQLFDEAIIVIGNDPAATLRLNGSVVAAEQVVIIDEAVHHVLINRAEGTYLNGEALPPGARRQLREGDDIRIGGYTVRIALPGGTNSSRRHEAGSQDALGINGAATEAGIVPAEPPSTPAPNAGSGPPAPKSFAAILDSLRTDEDRFYFLIEGGKQSGARVPVEGEVIPIGLDETGEQICFDAASIAVPRAVVHKDWSGVIVRAEGAGQISVNDEAVGDTRRLRDGDRLTLNAVGEHGRVGGPLTLVFHEPASLIVLDSLIPRTPAFAAGRVADAAPIQPVNPAASAAPPITGKLLAALKANTEYFGAFTLLELSLMAVSTLAGAVIIFLILNYS